MDRDTKDFLILRRARDDDSIALSTLGKQTFQETYIDELKIPYTDEDIKRHFCLTKTPEWYANKLADASRAVWLIEHILSHEIVAFIIVCPCKLPHRDVIAGQQGEIEYLYVRRDHQSIGLGKRLMNQALQWLQDQYPDQTVWISTLACNIKAQKMYKHFGFIQVGDYYSTVGSYKQREVILCLNYQPI